MAPLGPRITNLSPAVLAALALLVMGAAMSGQAGKPGAGEAADAVVQSAVNGAPVVVFSKTYCPYCKRVKGLFRELGVRPTYYELDTRPDGGDIQDALLRHTGIRSVPQVFVAGKFIGGSDDTSAKYQAGELKPLVMAAVGHDET